MIITNLTNTFNQITRIHKTTPFFTFTGNDNLKPKGDVFIHSSDYIDIGRIKNLNIRNFRLIDTKSIRGACLVSAKPYVLKELQEAGVESIIDLRSEGNENSKYAKYCKANGLNYYNIKIKDSDCMFVPRGNMKLNVEQFNRYKQTFVQKLKQFFELLDKGKVYIGCLHGLHRTDLALTTNYLLNSNEPQSIPLLSHMVFPEEPNLLKDRINSVKNLYNNLSKSDKEYLCLPEGYTDILNNRIRKLIIFNTKMVH